MKIARIRSDATGGRASHAIIEGNQATLLEGPVLEGIKPTSITVELDSISEYLPPVDPPNVLAIGLNYSAHARESGMELPERPLLFLKATTALTGHNQVVILPEIAPDEVDYEAELAVVIGKKAKNIPASRAQEYVLGYTCANDVSARDCQKRLDKQWARAKSFDTFAPVGPWIETELDPSALRIRSILNGEVMQDSNTADLIFPVEKLISYLSHSLTLPPGTMILTGTPAGVGAGRTPPVYLRNGDIIEVDIEGIGRLSNRVVSA